jgi:redox-sensitive bicupin YhaK (pirin superfamily)
MQGSVKLVLEPKKRSLGAFDVRRVLPSSKQRMVGPFIFFDHMGPAEFPAGKGIDVRPHPHVCLATVTYLFEGAMLHRDSLGTEIEITPGAVNWMTAGRGISHSERTPAALETAGHRLHGIQTWVALPKTHEETEPAFVHHPASTLPETIIDGLTVRLIAGTAFGMTSPVDYPHPIFYATVETQTGGRLILPETVEERCFYVVQGAAELNGETYGEGQMVILESGDEPELSVGPDTRVMLAGGAPMDGKRWIDWNFVASSPERIEKAKADWRASIAGGWINTPFTMPPQESEYIPLPGDETSNA